MQTYNPMKSGLNAAQLRSKTIANNIANINTPNYKRKYVKFEETLNNVNKTGKIEVKTDTSGAVRTDGNNVDLENEKVNQAANTLMYNGLVSITNIVNTISTNINLRKREL